MNTLITCASRRVALVREFTMHNRVIAVDCDQYSPALQFANEFYIVRRVDEPEYFDETEKLIKDRDINLLIPTLDDELEFWAERKEYFKSKGVWVSISPSETIRICIDKQRLAYFFLDAGLQDYFPKAAEGQIKYPAFIKPRFGSGSCEAYCAPSRKDLDYYMHCLRNEDNQDVVIQEYLEGLEFTVDCFFSRQHQLISYVPRYREKIRAGVSDRGRTFKSPELEKLILQISEKLPFEGSICMQGKITDKGIKFFEINPRFSGGIQLSIAAGYNPADLLSREMQGEILEPDLGNFKENIVMMPYEEFIFLDERKDLS